jgi:hypothetical protein
MSIVKKYVEYLKDNPKGYWFKREVWGLGWTPSRREGWVVIVGYALYLVWITTDFADEILSGMLPNDEPLMFMGKVAVSTLLLLWLCYRKGEPLRWQWGFPKDKIG